MNYSLNFFIIKTICVHLIKLTAKLKYFENKGLEFMYNYDLMGKEYANNNDKVLMHFSIEESEKGVNDLNLRRAGERNDLLIEYVVYAHSIIYHHLRAFFAIICIHGHVPDDFKHGVIIPVIKDNRKGPGDVDNYRPIIIISVFSKLFKIYL